MNVRSERAFGIEAAADWMASRGIEWERRAKEWPTETERLYAESQAENYFNDSAAIRALAVR